MEIIELKSGYKMPVLGLGTWQSKRDTCKEVVKKSLELGYRHIDTAWVYDNQEEVGQGIKESGIDREEIFVTSKVWSSSLAYEDVLEQCEETLNQLGLEYLDLYLIHWPNDDVPVEDTFKAFKKLKDEGKVRSFGISNFDIARTKEALEMEEKYVPVSVNQVEYHVYLNQEALLDFCSRNNIVLTAYSPLARGEIFDDSALKEISEEIGKTQGQVALRWLLQKGIVVIPKSCSEKHIKENMEILDFELLPEQMEKIDNIQKKKRIVNPGFFDD